MGKPYNWDEMTDSEKHDFAIALACSKRGELIMGQALYIAIARLKDDLSVGKEGSNIGDMEVLMEELFPMYSAIVNSPGMSTDEW
jgi:hypothetical protein